MAVPAAVAVPRSHLIAGQFQHLLLLAALLPGPWLLVAPGLDGGSWLGITDRIWLVAAIGIAVLHQVIVAIVWRTQLRFRLFTRLFGERDLAVWEALFLPLLVGRGFFVAGLGLADAGSLGLPGRFAVTVGTALLVPALYTGWSVHTHFGIGRAVGGDHFREAYRRMPFVRAGAFRWSANAMYVFGFLGLWAIAVLANSRAALAVALFQHAYIWVHWYTTEEPDLRVLYHDRPSG